MSERINSNALNPPPYADLEVGMTPGRTGSTARALSSIEASRTRHAVTGPLAELPPLPVSPSTGNRTSVRYPPLRDEAEVVKSDRLPGRSIRTIQSLVKQGTSLADLDWVAFAHYRSKPASFYVDENGETTNHGSTQKKITQAKKHAEDGLNAVIGLLRATVGLDDGPLDFAHEKRGERRSVYDQFEGLSPQAIMQLADSYRAEMPERRQTPPPVTEE
jgi:hypothetical protein